MLTAILEKTEVNNGSPACPDSSAPLVLMVDCHVVRVFFMECIYSMCSLSIAPRGTL